MKILFLGFNVLQSPEKIGIMTNTCAPKGCVISPVLFILYTNECPSGIASINPILKFAYGTAILGLISNKNEILYRFEVSRFVQMWKTNYLQLNVNRIKEMVIALNSYL